MSDDGRLALVTGGVQGLGAAAAKALERRDFRVAVAHLGADARARAFGAETGLPAREGDVADADACADGVARIVRDLGPLAVRVTNAGVDADGPFHQTSRADRDAVVDVDFGSMFNMCRPVIGDMRARGYGRIVDISPVNAQKGQFGRTHYGAAEAGVIGFTRALATESARHGITVNAIAPGYADTPMVQAMPDDIRRRIVAQVPLGRLAEPWEVGRCVAFLASENAGFITGATLSVDGGLYMS